MEAKIKLIKDCVKVYPDFPKKGINFRDIFPVLKEPKAFAALIEIMTDFTKCLEIDVVAGLESRGFLFGPIMAYKLGLPFVPIRKKGKLPGPVEHVEYSLEYGKDSLEIQKNVITPGQRVILVDDLIATGGSLEASCRLMKKIGANVVHCLAVMELTDLKGSSKIKFPVHSVIKY